MAEGHPYRNKDGVDISLVAAFLRLTPEERLVTNDNAVKAILELRDAFQQQKDDKRRSQQNP